MKRFQIARAGLVLLTAVCLSAASLAQNLAVGMKAPPLPVKEWVKGEPVKEFKSDQFYVVEFWATWCDPCKENIPHLTEMAKKFKGKVTFIGVSVLENDLETNDENEYIPRVKKFVKDMGKTMDYTVGVDSWDGKIAKTWLMAAGQDGIPSAFIVDKKGRVAWIGHPADGMEETLDEMVAGRLDLDDLLAQKQAIEEAVEALQSGDYHGAVSVLDKAIEKYPSMEGAVAPLKFQTLMTVNEKKAYEYARKLMDGIYKEDAMMLNTIAWAIVDDETPKQNPDNKLALEMAEKAVGLMKEDSWLKAMIMDTQALALFRNDKVQQAIDAQTKAVEMAKAHNNDESGMMEPDREATLAEMEARLVLFKKKKD